MHLVNALPGVVAQGLIWGIMAVGVYITYKLLDIADLTVDGSICTGAAVCTMMLPLAFRFGTERGRALFLLVAALLLGGGLFFQASAPGRMPTPAQAAALASAASLLLFCASCLLSVRIWENREF